MIACDYLGICIEAEQLDKLRVPKEAENLLLEIISILRSNKIIMCYTHNEIIIDLINLIVLDYELSCIQCLRNSGMCE